LVATVPETPWLWVGWRNLVIAERPVDRLAALGTADLNDLGLGGRNGSCRDHGRGGRSENEALHFVASSFSVYDVIGQLNLNASIWMARDHLGVSSSRRLTGQPEHDQQQRRREQYVNQRHWVVLPVPDRAPGAAVAQFPDSS
jgi:hypothetical protein